MKTVTLRRVLLPGAATLLALAAACGTDGGDGGDTGPSAAFNEADVAFTQDMLMHHQQALEVAELAQTRAQDAALSEVASSIAATLEPQITTMNGWLAAWGEPAQPEGGHDGMSMPGMATEDEMAALMEASGVEFDRMFARMMIAHHGGALQMCQDVQTQGMNQDVNDLATTIEEQRSAELATLEEIIDRL
jgi:uncharacterized protein (DUF305 family)